MKQAVYIETTIISYLTARPSRDLVGAAQQQITRDWWERGRSQFDLFTSEFVDLEAAAGDPDAASRRLQILAGLDHLPISDKALELADHLIRTSALPAKAIRDAEHVAVAAAGGIDILLTWNYTHLANVILRDKIEEVCEEFGYRPPKICTPGELSGGWHDRD